MGFSERSACGEHRNAPRHASSRSGGALRPFQAFATQIGKGIGHLPYIETRNPTRGPEGGWTGVLAPGVGQYEARLHASHAVEFAALWYLPAGQSAHDEAPLPSAYEPAAHSAGAVAPSTHAEPAGQATQAAWPAIDCHVPASHREHTKARDSAYSPVPHF